jgi:hypothetical protein
MGGLMHSYYLGLDLGQRADPTALAVIEEPQWIPEDDPVWVRTVGNQSELRSGWVSPADITTYDAKRVRRAVGPERPVLALKHLHRYPLGTSYPDIVQHVAELLSRPPLLGRTVLLVDATGVGRPVVDLFERAKLSPLAITITGGNEVHQEGSELHVPKRDLAMAVQILLQNRRLVFAGALPLLDILKRELQSFEVKITKTGNDTYEAWRVGAHDDTVLACAMACWYREWSNPEGMHGFMHRYDQRERPSENPRSGRQHRRLGR